MTIKVAPGIYSFLSAEDLLRIRRAIQSAYPHQNREQKRRTYVTLACQPAAALKFIDNVNRINKEDI